LIGGGNTRFQPVYVGDVADAVLAGLANDQSKGKIFELGGPEILTFKEIYARLFRETARKKILISLPWGVAKFQGCVMNLLPKPPLTADQVESLKTDTIVAPHALTFQNLGMAAT